MIFKTKNQDKKHNKSATIFLFFGVTFFIASNAFSKETLTVNSLVEAAEKGTVKKANNFVSKADANDYYPFYKLDISKDVKLAASDPKGALVLHDQNFLNFMKVRELDKSIFFLHMSIPKNVKISTDGLAFQTVLHNFIEIGGVTKYIKIPFETAAYMFDKVEEFKKGFNRTTYKTLNNKNIYQGFFKVFIGRCFGGGYCFHTVQIVSPDPMRANSTYRRFKISRLL